MHRIALLLGALALAGCEHQYVYQPAVSTTSAVAGRPASYYTIPPEAPRGDVRVATFGFVDIQPTQQAKGEEKMRGLGVRMVVTNNSDQPWTVDTREQVLALPGKGESRAAFVSVDQGPIPEVTVPPGGKRVIDLFYPLPADMQKASKVPEFDTVWKVRTGTREVVERTPFERLEVEPVYTYSYDYYGWGPPYWYDPYYYPSGAFVGVHMAPAYVAHPVTIRPYSAPAAAPPARIQAPPAHP